MAVLLCIIGPGAVHNLKAISISPYVVNITWNPPNLPNGIITMYKITLKSLLSNDMLHQWAVSPNNALSVIASNLGILMCFKCLMMIIIQ